jgi:hypothetical protein
MLADFCLRLACGLIACLLVLSPRQVQPRFYRVHFLTALGLALVAALALSESSKNRGPFSWLLIGALVALPFLGSLVWSLERAPGKRSVIVASTVVFVVALCISTGELIGFDRPAYVVPGEIAWVLAGELASALLLGSATTAMLMGHSYLIAPTMSLAPLLRLIALLGWALLLRSVLAGTALWFWTREHTLASLNEVTLLLPVRWALGFAAPVVLGVMAWRSARIRSTQSATGILYVVVIFCFLGELVGLLLQRMTGRAM